MFPWNTSSLKGKRRGCQATQPLLENICLSLSLPPFLPKHRLSHVLPLNFPSTPLSVCCISSHEVELALDTDTHTLRNTASQARSMLAFTLLLPSGWSSVCCGWQELQTWAGERKRRSSSVIWSVACFCHYNNPLRRRREIEQDQADLIRGAHGARFKGAAGKGFREGSKLGRWRAGASPGEKRGVGEVPRLWVSVIALLLPPPPPPTLPLPDCMGGSARRGAGARSSLLAAL